MHAPTPADTRGPLPPPEDIVRQALHDHRAGRLEAAERLYRRALATAPGLADALHLLGLVDLQRGRAAAALPALRRALRGGGERAVFRNSLGEAWRTLGDGGAAAESYRRAVVENPAYGEAYRNLGVVLEAGGDAAAACAALHRATTLGQGGAGLLLALARLRRDRGEAIAARDAVAAAHRLVPGDASVAAARADAERAAGDAWMARGGHGPAAAAYRAALALRPDFVEVLNNLGGAALARHDHGTAERLYRRALAVRPDYPDAHNNRAYALMEAGRLDVAAASLRRSVAIRPDAADPYANLAYTARLVAADATAYAAAERLGRRALRLHPGHGVAHNNLGIVALDLGRLAEAEAAFRAALAVRGDDPDAHFNLALVLLKSGRFAQGWEEYEWRWRTRQLTPPAVARPAWEGEDPAGRTILLHAEQGHGDTLHFIRYAPLLARRGARVLVLVQPALARLVAAMPEARAGAITVLGHGDPVPPHDLQCPLMSLPRLFGTTLDTIPATVPYLVAPADAAARWAGRWPRDGRLTVGLVWSGDPRPDVVRAHQTDRRRSVGLDRFAALAGVPGVRFVSLQKGAAAAQAKAPPPGMDLLDWMDEVGDFADTAGLVAGLDLVISVDTSVAHLAGALGVPVWVLSRHDACWRWLMDRRDSPWYPTLRLYRQPAPGDWDAVFAAVARDLAALAAPAAAPVPAPLAAPVPAPVPAPVAVPGVVERLLAAALAHHRAGRAAAAAALYRRVLALEPAHGDALHLLGAARLAEGGAAREGGAGPVRAALRLSPAEAIYHNTLGEALRLAGRGEAAAARYRRAVALRPAYGEALRNLAGVQRGGEAAVAAARAAVRIDPAAAEPWHALALAQRGAGRSAAAGAAQRAARSLQPDHADALAALGALERQEGRRAAAAHRLRRAALLAPGDAGVHNNHGVALQDDERPGEAVACYRRALALEPAHADAWRNLGVAGAALGRPEAALAAHRRAQRVDPAHAEAGHGAAEAHRLMGAFARAADGAHRALALRPDYAEAWNTLGVVRQCDGRLADSAVLFDRVLALRPGDAVARFNLSLSRLRAGDYARGWPLYEARWEMPGVPQPPVRVPQWRGEDPAGRTILLHAEQGHGDTLQFVRYAPLLARRGARVILAVQPALKRLLAALPGVAAVHGLEEAFGGFDLHCPLMSLPVAFGTTLATIPAEPYLTAQPEWQATWRARLAGERRRTVGLVWAGEPRPQIVAANAVDRRRSLTLAALAPLAGTAGVAFFSLQKGAPAQQARTPPPGLELTDWMDAVGDFADTAGLIAQLDLVITVDTSVAHLAGGMGKPVWVLSRHDACWRWLSGREDSPWYPRTRLYTQPAAGAWGPVIERVAGDLRAWAGGGAVPAGTPRGDR